MILLKEPELDQQSVCPYLTDKNKQFEYFFAHRLTGEEIARLLAEGWRKFGVYYFRPACPECRECIPIRIPADTFSPSKSQRRNLRKNSNMEVRFVSPEFNSRVYEIYRKHSRERFGDETSLEDFIHTFYTPSCPSIQSEYYLEGELLAVGFLDMGNNCLSSVYFVYDTDYSSLGLGTFSVLKEIEHAKKLGLKYYYLGYYVAGCGRMTYKGNFLPRERFDWAVSKWETAEA
ncbi:MAG: arginyltransferase [Proteobacteria bacterium]|nr:arginyltransferase [Pseudomonadota bacterium]